MSIHRQYLVFCMRGVRYGVALDSCHEVNLRSRVYPVPRARPHISGIMNLRGEVVTVIDLPSMFSPSKGEASSGAVIRLKAGEHPIAIRVDAVEDGQPRAVELQGHVAVAGQVQAHCLPAGAPRP